jgi:hypothetical protein
MRTGHIAICGPPGSMTFFHIISYMAWYLKKKKKTYWTWNVFWVFSTPLIWNISHFKSYWARYDQKCILVFMQSAHYSCQILMNSNRSRKGHGPKMDWSNIEEESKEEGHALYTAPHSLNSVTFDYLFGLHACLIVRPCSFYTGSKFLGQAVNTNRWFTKKLTECGPCFLVTKLYISEVGNVLHKYTVFVNIRLVESKFTAFHT